MIGLNNINNNINNNKKGSSSSSGRTMLVYSLALTTFCLLFSTTSGAQGGGAGVSIDRTFMDQVRTSFRLSGVVFETDLVGNEAFYIARENLQTLTGYKRYAFGGTSGEVIDQALVAKDTNSICYGVFRGVSGIADFAQSLNLGNAGSESCHGRQGYYEAYVNEYQAAFEANLNTCIASCTNGDCPLILSGFSQGGAVAVIASLFWEHKNPQVVTFAAPRAVQAPCPAIHPENHFRFVAANNNDIGMWYDPVVMAPGLGSVHFGHSIIIGSTPASAHQPASPPLNDDSTRDPLDLTLVAHDFLEYRDRIEWMNSAPNFPIQAKGFKNDVQCGYNDECESGRCEGVFPPYKCKAKEGSCGQCNENSDCASGICLLKSTQSVCAEPDGRMADSCFCDFNSDCQSGRCEGAFPPFQCHARLGSGASCNEHSDCQSNNCRFEWFQWKCA